MYRTMNCCVLLRFGFPGNSETLLSSEQEIGSNSEGRTFPVSVVCRVGLAVSFGSGAPALHS